MKRLLSAVFCALALARPGFASIADQLDSVHFNSAELDFGIPPRRGAVWSAGTPCSRPVSRPRWAGTIDGDDLALNAARDEERERKRADRAQVWLARAARFEATGDANGARRCYAALGPLGWSPGGRRDALEVLAHGRCDARIARYLHALRITGRDCADATEARAIFAQLADDPAAPGFLRGHALYQLGALDGAATLERFLAEYPGHAKTEAALIMLARQTLGDMRIGALNRLLQDFPHSRFRAAALGLRAQDAFRAGRIAEAAHAYLALNDLNSASLCVSKLPAAVAGPLRVPLIAAYLHRLPTATTHRVYRETVTGIVRQRAALDRMQALALRARLLADPELASAYLYVRVYHTNDRSSDAVRAAAQLAEQVVARDPGARLSPDVCVRLAEIWYQRGQTRRSLAFAERALERQESDRALFVRGAARFRLGRIDGAYNDFRRLLTRYPQSELGGGARENLALLCERRKDLAGALDQYLTLGYAADIAYLLDVRMSTAQVSAYRKRASRAWRERLTYTLGIRQLRDGAYDAAIRTLRQVPPKAYYALGEMRRDTYSSNGASPDPITVAQALRCLEQQRDAARTDAQRAAALYALASYTYRNGTLLFYNGALWQGTREFNVDFFWNPKAATPTDWDDMHRHMAEHETYVRTSALCRRLADRYPRSAYAPQALYRAACAEERLSDFNDWWREHEHPARHLARAGNLMNRLARTYPRDPLARHARKYARLYHTAAAEREAKPASSG